MADSSVTFLDLPAELLDSIFRERLRDAFELGKRDILNLRLVCLETSAAVDDVFLDAFYSKRRHLFTRHSLEYLVTISGDVRLRRKLRSIEFIPVHLDLAGFEPNGVLRKQWNAERGTFFGQGLDVTLLVQAFQNLASASILPTLSLGAHVPSWHGSSPFGTAHLSKQLGALLPRVLLFVPDRLASRETAYGLVSAIAASKFPNRGLSFPNYDMSASLACFDVDTGHFASLASAFSNLRTLNVTLHKSSAESTKAGLKIFTGALASASQLTSLELRYDRRGLAEEDSCIASQHKSILESLSNSRLRSLTLVNGCVDWQDLHKFLLRHKTSLFHLELRGFRLRTPWRSTFKWMAKNLDLEDVKLTRLLKKDMMELVGRVRLTKDLAYGHRFEGEEEVKKGLVELAGSSRWKMCYGELWD